MNCDVNTLRAKRDAGVTAQELKQEGCGLAALKAANLVRKDVLTAKVIKSGEISRKVAVKGLKVTKGAREAIEAAGGNIEG